MFVTTYNKEFKWPGATGWGRKVWMKKRNSEENKTTNEFPVYRNYETLSQVTKQCLIPFDYLLEPKPIIQTHPRTLFSIEDIRNDESNTQARLTRPRVYKAPEISLDDIKDPAIREKIINYTYSTTSGLASKGAAQNITKREIPNSAWEPPYHVLFNKKETSSETRCRVPDVSDKQLNEWDTQQSRCVGDPTLDFWRRFRTQKADEKAVDQPVIDVKSPCLTEKIMTLAKEEKLRFPFTLKPPNYTGFMPENPILMDPLKIKRDIKDPMLSVYELSNRWAEMKDHTG